MAVTKTDAARVDDRVLEIVAALTVELQGALAPARITLDQSLERDLSIGSLERVELLLRLEHAFGVRLSEAAMMDAESPADLARAVQTAGPSGAGRVPERLEAVGAASAAPASAATLIDALRWHVERSPERVHVFLGDEHGGERAITYRALWDQALAVSAGLLARNVGPGDSVALMLRTEEPFYAAFVGTLLAGAVPVPIYPPYRADRIEEYTRRQLAILTNARARLLVTFAEAERVAGLLRSRAGALAAVTTVARLVAGGDRPRPARRRASDPALIQYTSGSTGDPKGVLLTHANLLANIRAIGEALAIGPDDVGVSWLPLYHDMGLIGAWLGSLYFGTPITILSPLSFLARPARWLWALHAHRGTISPAPNFAFDLCVKRIADDEIRGLDLSAWRLALNGSEPVSRATIDRFTRRFAPYGFRPEAMCPTYGLAEASVGLTVGPIGRRPRVELGFVSCGLPLPGHEVRIVDDAGTPVAERIEGRIEFRGPSVTSGYFHNPSATRAMFREGWCDSGDLGFRADGELFVTGRRKDLVIKAGRNLHPHHVEELVGEVPGIRKGCVAVFGVPDAALGTERLVVVAESREPEAAARERLRAAVVERVVAGLGIPPDVVAIYGPGTVLKTPSGKIRRGATRDAYRAGQLGAHPSTRRQWARLLALDLVARLRRVPGTARALAYAGWIGVVLAIAFPLLWVLALLLPRGRPVDRVARIWSRIVLAIAGCRLRVEGLGALPARGSALLVCNHSSYLDVPALLAAIPTEFRFVAKRELARAPVIGAVIRNARHLTVDRVDLSRGVADAETITRVLRQGTSILFFPEGTFVRASGILPFRLGAFKAAVEARCPVIPVGLSGTRDILPADRWLPRRGPITVTIGSPIVPAKDDWREMVRIRDLARAEVARAAGEPLVEERET
jgi:1-acyl-sn-glycerol-3-phosphate acyltransferase